MKKSFWLIFWVMSIVKAFAQEGLESQVNIEAIRAGNLPFRSVDHRDKSLRGSPYAFETYLPGSIKMSSGQIVTIDKINYDGYYDVLVVFRNDQEQIVTTTAVELFYVIRHLDTLVFEKHLRPDGQAGFYQRLSFGDHVRLYKRHGRRLEEPTYTGPYSSGKDYPELVPVNEYFLKEGKFRLKEFKNKKTVVAMFAKEEDQLKIFFKENHIDFKEEKDLISLANYLNNLRSNKGGDLN